MTGGRDSGAGRGFLGTDRGAGPGRHATLLVRNPLDSTENTGPTENNGPTEDTEPAEGTEPAEDAEDAETTSDFFGTLVTASRP